MKLRELRTVYPCPIPGVAGATSQEHFRATSELTLTFEGGLVTIHSTKPDAAGDDVIVPVSGGVKFMRPVKGEAAVTKKAA